MKKYWIKNTISIVFIIATLVACDAPEGISGKLNGVEKKESKIYLIQPATLHDVAASYFGTVVDSAVVNSTGNFTFSNLPKTVEPVLFEIAIQPFGKLPNYLQNDDPTRSNYMPIVWQPGESIQITANWDEFQKSFLIENPSEINAAMLNLRDVNQKAYQTYLKGKHWELEDGDQLMDKEHSILQYQTELIQFANNTPHLMPALVALRWVSPANYYERVPEFLVNQCNKWTKNQPDHPWTKELCNQSQPANLPVLIGDKFPNLTLPMITKDTLSLTDQLGSKLTIIDLWASWCAPCRIENREVLVPIWDEYHDQGVQIIGYSLEGNRSGWVAAVEKDGADRWLQSSELQGDDSPILKTIRIRTIPANFILDEKGVVVAKNLHGKDLEKELKLLFKN
jgi:thiol-disulfide isomerase/thioredoxin